MCIKKVEIKPFGIFITLCRSYTRRKNSDLCEFKNKFFNVLLKNSKKCSKEELFWFLQDHAIDLKLISLLQEDQTTSRRLSNCMKRLSCNMLDYYSKIIAS